VETDNPVHSIKIKDQAMKSQSRMLRVAPQEWEVATRIAPTLPRVDAPPHPAEVLRHAMKLGLSALTNQQR